MYFVDCIPQHRNFEIGCHSSSVIFIVFQYCDVHVPEIQEVIDKVPLPLPDVKCHERDGWLPSGFADQCREIINNLVVETLKTSGTYAG